MCVCVCVVVVVCARIGAALFQLDSELFHLNPASRRYLSKEMTHKTIKRMYVFMCVLWQQCLLLILT